MSLYDVRFDYDMEFAEFLHYPEQVQRDIMNFRLGHNRMEILLLEFRRNRIRRMQRYYDEDFRRYPEDSIRVQVPLPEDFNAQFREMRGKHRKEKRAIIRFLENPSSYSISVDQLRVISQRERNLDVRLSEYIDWIYDLERTRKIHKSILDNVSYFLSFHECQLNKSTEKLRLENAETDGIFVRMTRTTGPHIIRQRLFLDSSQLDTSDTTLTHYRTLWILFVGIRRIIFSTPP